MNSSRQSKLLLILYTCSGATALAYEVLWTRMLSLLFGTSIIGVVVTVAAFMLGLGLGSFLGHRWQVGMKRSLFTLAAIEMSVAIYAILLPSMMQALQGMYWGVNKLDAWQCWQVSSALLVLTLPALALGFAFPWMLRVGQARSLSLGLLYGFNTLGGALGALSPLVLLPILGWDSALHTVAGLAVLIAIILFILAFKTSPQTVPNIRQSFKPSTLSSSCLLAYAGMGAAALVLEMAWTRAFGMVLLRTEYVLAVILFVFLFGIGVGSIMAKHLPRRKILAWAPIFSAVVAILGLYAFPYVNDSAQRSQWDNLWAALAFQGGLIALCTLPVTLILGAWLPLIADKNQGASLYAANSLGASIGALLAGFVLIPYVGTAGTWGLATILLMLCGFYWSKQYQQGWVMGASFIAMLCLAWFAKDFPPASRLLVNELPQAHDLYQSEDAISITHVVERKDGQRILLADLQRMDASSDPTSVAVQRNQARLPLFLQGNPKQVLCLGLGTGITASGALAWSQASIDAVELSQGAVHASITYFSKVNLGLPERIHVIHDDARRYLMRTNKHYDVIMGDLFHPDMVGRGALLSVEQFERAKQHLTPQGVFVQWLALNQFDVKDMQVVIRSFADVFAHNAVFIDGYRIALIGFQGQMLDSLTLLHHAPEYAMWGGEGGWTWLGRYWGSMQALLQSSTSKKMQGEWSPVIEYALPHMRYQSSPLPHVLRWLLQSRISFDAAVKTMVVPLEYRQDLKRAWAATSLNMRAQWEALQGKPSAGRLQALAYRANPHDRWASFALADAMFESLAHTLPHGMTQKQALGKILSIRPDHERALKAMYQLAKQAQDAALMKQYRAKLKVLSPYARLSE
ncbi:MAG: fused MFS/spermidine synthase [Mariprofundaceae bacterium]|nr:fused MFS/spermidine synthase [Mariprofundaceae bacterium]